RVQAITAFKEAVRLRPELLPAHEALFGLYMETKSLDLALQHLRELISHGRTLGPRGGEPHAAFLARLQNLEEEERGLGKHVRDLQSLADSDSFRREVLERAQIAQNRQLPGRA